MLSTAHTLISLPFGVYMDNPLLIFTATFVFHLFSDTLLHWNIFPFKFKRYPFELVALDVIAGIVMSWFVLGNTLLTLPILTAIAGGNMPDILNAFWEMLNKKTHHRYFKWAIPFFDWHNNLQFETVNVIPGVLWQIALAALAVLLVK